MRVDLAKARMRAPPLTALPGPRCRPGLSWGCWPRGPRSRGGSPPGITLPPHEPLPWAPEPHELCGAPWLAVCPGLLGSRAAEKAPTLGWTDRDSALGP